MLENRVHIYIFVQLFLKRVSFLHLVKLNANIFCTRSYALRIFFFAHGPTDYVYIFCTLSYRIRMFFCTQPYQIQIFFLRTVQPNTNIFAHGPSKYEYFCTRSNQIRIILKHIYFTHRWDHHRYYHSRLE